MTGLTGDPEIVHALARRCSHVCVPIGRYAGISDVELLDQLAKLGAEFGDVMREVQLSLADGRVSERELKAIEGQLYEMNAAGAAMLKRMEALLDRRPAIVRAVK